MSSLTTFHDTDYKRSIHSIQTDLQVFVWGAESHHTKHKDTEVLWIYQYCLPYFLHYAKQVFVMLYF